MTQDFKLNLDELITKSVDALEPYLEEIKNDDVAIKQLLASVTNDFTNYLYKATDDNIMEILVLGMVTNFKMALQNLAMGDELNDE